MPTKIIFVPAPVVLRHRRVKIHATYRNDDAEDCRSDYWFGLHNDTRQEDGFDVRDLPDWRDMTDLFRDRVYRGKIPMPAAVVETLKAAIDRGLLKNPALEELNQPK